MKTSKLRQVLNAFETTNGSLSLPQLAEELEVSPARLDGMIQHWVRKGKIRERDGVTECGSCGQNGSCAFVMDMPRSYELATNENLIPLSMVPVSCSHKGL